MHNEIGNNNGTGDGVWRAWLKQKVGGVLGDAMHPLRRMTSYKILTAY